MQQLPNCRSIWPVDVDLITLLASIAPPTLEQHTERRRVRMIAVVSVHAAGVSNDGERDPQLPHGFEEGMNYRQGFRAGLEQVEDRRWCSHWT